MSDFYEDDEPVENVRAAFGAGPHLLTAPPLRRVEHDFNAGATWAVDRDGPQDFKVGQRIELFCCCTKVEAVITAVQPLPNRPHLQYLTVEADEATWSDA